MNVSLKTTGNRRQKPIVTIHDMDYQKIMSDTNIVQRMVTKIMNNDDFHSRLLDIYRPEYERGLSNKVHDNSPYSTQ
jgi:hypothetical protein